MQAPERGIGQQFEAVRRRTEALVAPLSAEDCCVQSMPDASPAKWHLAHTTWFFETFILERHEPGFRPFDADFRMLFNSYYHAIGERHPRPQRGMLTRPPLARVMEYRREVDERMARLLEDLPSAEIPELAILGIHHEQQHQELILTDIKHLLSLHPGHPAYARGSPLPAEYRTSPLTWQAFDGGLANVGHDGKGFAFDNEGPRHRVFLAPYRLASRLVTNGEFLEFIGDGGYRDPRLWLSDGWDWLAGRRTHPCYWFEHTGEWQEFTLHGARPLDPGAPAVHLSYYEADAFARWAGARLPTEAEWENAASARPVEGNFADNDVFHPVAARDPGLQQLYGDTWEWTQSAYAPYPGFRPAAGAVGEYNGKFMVNQYVLRGGSCATPQSHIRPSYRNFFPASGCWQFSGIRLAAS